MLAGLSCCSNHLSGPRARTFSRSPGRGPKVKRLRSCWARSCWVNGADFAGIGGLGFAGLGVALVWGCAGAAIDRATRMEKNLRMNALWRVKPLLAVRSCVLGLGVQVPPPSPGYFGRKPLRFSTLPADCACKILQTNGLRIKYLLS